MGEMNVRAMGSLWCAEYTIGSSDSSGLSKHHIMGFPYHHYVHVWNVDGNNS
jgi:hypothetical protein